MEFTTSETKSDSATAKDKNIGALFYLLAAVQILTIAGGAGLGLLVAPASLFVSRTENEAFAWIVFGFAGLANVALGACLIPLSIVAASGFRRGRKRRKIVGVAVSILAIPGFPLGTACGSFLLYKIWRESE